MMLAHITYIVHQVKQPYVVGINMILHTVFTITTSNYLKTGMNGV